MTARGWFVTGTDTGVGKTRVSVALIHALRGRGLRVLAMKPVASGCEVTPEGLRNGDALALQRAASFPIPYPQVNPYAFAPPIAPHLAARRAGVTIDSGPIVATAQALAARCDRLVVEGVGGWRVPLADGMTVAELALQLDLPVILVVAMRLGCLSHALLTAESIASAGLPLAGWVANFTEPHMEAARENVEDLELRLPAPCLGVIPFLPEDDPGAAAAHLDPDPLLTAPRLN